MKNINLKNLLAIFVLSTFYYPEGLFVSDGYAKSNKTKETTEMTKEQAEEYVLKMLKLVNDSNLGALRAEISDNNKLVKSFLTNYRDGVKVCLAEYLLAWSKTATGSEILNNDSGNKLEVINVNPGNSVTPVKVRIGTTEFTIVFDNKHRVVDITTMGSVSVLAPVLTQFKEYYKNYNQGKVLSRKNWGEKEFLDLKEFLKAITNKSK